MARPDRAPNRPARWAMAGTFLGVGGMHFVRPADFEAIVPDEIPAKRFWVLATGVAEVAGGVALLVRPNRRVGWLLVALLALVFPANVNQAVRRIRIDGLPEVPRWLLLARLPVQFVMMWAVLAATRPEPPS